MTTTQIDHVARDPAGCELRIEGIPGAIPRARVLELVESLGIDPKEMRSLTFEPDAIYAEVYALKDGKKYWDGGTDHEIARHRIAIPITDGATAYDVDRSYTEALKASENWGSPGSDLKSRLDGNPDASPER